MTWVRNLCRLCGQIGTVCYNIFDPSLRLKEKIKRCLNFQISEDDFKPREICNSCCNKVEDILEFMDLCISTSNRFESMYYADTYSVTPNDKNLYEHSIGQIHANLDCQQQSVIVSNRNGNSQGTEYQEINKDETIVILESCNINNQPVLQFNMSYNNMQATELGTFLADGKEFAKPVGGTKNIPPEELTRNNQITQQCPVLANSIPNDLLESFGNQVPDTIVERVQSHRVSLPIHHMEEPQLNPSYVSDNRPKEKLKNKSLVSVDTIRMSLDSEHLFSKMRNSELKKKSDKSYPCPHCEKTFKRRLNLTAHISVHTNIKGYKCSNCSKTFAVKCHLTQHAKTHSDFFKCHICQKRFQVPSKLARHMQTHSANKPFVCTFTNCNKAFADKHNLKQHILCHTAARTVSCNICDKLFKARKHLNAHIKTHVSETLYKCMYCDKNFRYKHSLKKHILKHNN